MGGRQECWENVKRNVDNVKKILLLLRQIGCYQMIEYYVGLTPVDA